MRLGLTGGLASGKSRVARALAELGAAVVDADALAREAVEPGTPGFRAVVAAFGREYVGPDGALDRQKLGRLVFADDSARKLLEEIVHPEVKRLMEARAFALERAGNRVVVLEIPLLYEAGLDKQVDKVIVVDAPTEVQVARAVARGGLSAEEAGRRLAVQLPREERLRRADYVVDNSRTWAETQARVQGLWEEIQREETHRPHRP